MARKRMVPKTKLQFNVSMELNLGKVNITDLTNRIRQRLRDAGWVDIVEESIRVRCVHRILIQEFKDPEA